MLATLHPVPVIRSMGCSFRLAQLRGLQAWSCIFADANCNTQISEAGVVRSCTNTNTNTNTVQIVTHRSAKWVGAIMCRPLLFGHWHILDEGSQLTVGTLYTRGEDDEW